MKIGILTLIGTVAIAMNCVSYAEKGPVNPGGGFIVKKGMGGEELMYCQGPSPKDEKSRALCYPVDN